LVVEAKLALAVFTWEVGQALDREAARQGRHAQVHVKVDTGMGRIGVPQRDALGLLEALHELEHLSIQGIYTHFATADHADKSFTYRQVEVFQEICEEAESRGISIPLRHLSNSAAVLDLPETFQDLVRPGIMIYGCYPSEDVKRDLTLRPAMTWKTHVAFIKDLQPGESVSYGRTFVARRSIRVATLPLGYADGFSRHHSNRGEVLIRGVGAPVLGVVCMDMTMVDVTHLADVNPGDEVVIFGRQGNRVISVEEVAQRIGTISYEVLCGVGARVPRVYPENPSRGSEQGS
jgi:alanine racemase